MTSRSADIFKLEGTLPIPSHLENTELFPLAKKGNYGLSATNLNRKMVAYEDLMIPELLADTMSPPMLFFSDSQMLEGMQVFKKVHEQMYFPCHTSGTTVGRDLLVMNWYSKDKEEPTAGSSKMPAKMPAVETNDDDAPTAKKKKQRDSRLRSNITGQMYWACSCCNNPLIEVKKLKSKNDNTMAWKNHIMSDYQHKFVNSATNIDECWLVVSYGFHKDNCSCVTHSIPKKNMGIVTWDLPAFFMDHTPRMKSVGMKWYNHVKVRDTQVIDDHVEESESNKKTGWRYYGVYHCVDHPDGLRIPGVHRKIDEYKYNHDKIFGATDTRFAREFGLLLQLVIKMRFHLVKSFHQAKNYMGDQGFIAGGNVKQSLHCDHQPKADNSLIDECAEQERLGHLVSIPGVVVVPITEKGRSMYLFDTRDTLDNRFLKETKLGEAFSLDGNVRHAGGISDDKETGHLIVHGYLDHVQCSRHIDTNYIATDQQNQP